MTNLLVEKLAEVNIHSWRNEFSNTVFFPRPDEKIVKKYALACNTYPDFGELAHIVVMQYFSKELIEQIVADIAK
jgi:hypothetical protein